MKIKKIIKTKSPLIKLRLLQAKNYKKIYSMINLNIKNIQYRFVKSLKILYKYVFNNKTILFLNKASIINITLKRLLTKTRHIFISNFIKLKNKKICLNSDLFFILTKKINMSILNQFCQVKIPVFLITNNFDFKNYNFEISYKILGNIILKKNQHFLFFIFLYSIILKKHKFINL
jgi:hypothetical protein